jgi:hypothetical protein
MPFSHYRTPDHAERVKVLPPFGKRTVVYSLGIFDVLLKDILIIQGHFQSTNEMLLPCLLGSNVILTANPLDAVTNVANVPTGADEVVETTAAFNLTRDMHHGTVYWTASWTVKKAIPNAFLNAVAWTSNENNKTLLVDDDRGALCCVKLRN